MPAPLGNTNAVKHGLRSKRYGLVHAKQGKRFASAYGHCNQLRREVESLVRQGHGGLSLLQLAKIQSLLRLEEGIRACEKVIAETPKMAPNEVRQTRWSISQWTMQRDSLLAELLGDCGGKADPWALLDQKSPTPSQVDIAATRMANAIERTTTHASGADDSDANQGNGNAQGKAERTQEGQI